MLLCGYFLIFMFHFYLCNAVLSVPDSLVVICWEKADILAPLCVVFIRVFVTFPIDVGVRCIHSRYLPESTVDLF